MMWDNLTILCCFCPSYLTLLCLDYRLSTPGSPFTVYVEIANSLFSLFFIWATWGEPGFSILPFFPQK